MTRPIKFRAWDTDEKKWLAAPFADVVIELETSQDDEKGFTVKVPPGVKLVWSTGLTDKNGKEIYQGDITKNKYGVVHEIVQFRAGFALYKHNHDPKVTGHIYLDCNDDIEKDLEVIGNIHENPNLLEPKVNGGKELLDDLTTLLDQARQSGRREALEELLEAEGSWETLASDETPEESANIARDVFVDAIKDRLSKLSELGEEEAGVCSSCGGKMIRDDRGFMFCEQCGKDDGREKFVPQPSKESDTKEVKMSKPNTNSALREKCPVCLDEIVEFWPNTKIKRWTYRIGDQTYHRPCWHSVDNALQRLVSKVKMAVFEGEELYGLEPYSKLRHLLKEREQDG